MNTARLQPSVRNPLVERRTCDAQRLGKFLFVEEPTAVCHQIALVLMLVQPVVETTEYRIGILQPRFIPFISPNVQARRINPANSGSYCNSRTSVSKHSSSEAWTIIFRRRGIEKSLIFYLKMNSSAFYYLTINELSF